MKSAIELCVIGYMLNFSEALKRVLIFNIYTQRIDGGISYHSTSVFGTGRVW